MAKLPKTLGGLIDRLYTMREDRLLVQRKLDEMKEAEREVQGAILSALAAQRTERASGKLATAGRKLKTVAKVTDWQKLYAYIAKTDSWDLIQKRVNNAAYVDRLEHSERVPGVEARPSSRSPCTRRPRREVGRSDRRRGVSLQIFS